jgi:small subunit ribosomal protein S20
MRQDERRTLINQRIRRQMKLTVKKMRQKPSSKTFQEVSRTLDKAAKKNIIHRNKASRLKSRLAKRLSPKKKKIKQKPTSKTH